MLLDHFCELWKFSIFYIFHIFRFLLFFCVLCHVSMSLCIVFAYLCICVWVFIFVSVSLSMCLCVSVSLCTGRRVLRTPSLYQRECPKFICEHICGSAVLAFPLSFRFFVIFIKWRALFSVQKLTLSRRIGSLPPTANLRARPSHCMEIGNFSPRWRQLMGCSPPAGV